MVIDLSLFDDDQREALMRELSLHGEVVLSNKRREAARRMIKE